MLVVGVTSSPAFATDQNLYLYSGNTIVGGLKFIDDGDDWELWDYYADGHGVRAYIQVRATGNWYDWDNGSWYNGKGAGTMVKKTDGNLYSINDYRAQVCTVDGANDKTPVRCSAWMYVNE
ncbi:hypothetical protein [Kitasatospora fiedleri]|uniref:hypothetical protein n=1 Tax=Kitasatospora fiedleri TaxID=2991545 RepID=UPI000C2BA229|nr:hypothetical protein [Kitasatospora fiedleri]